MRDDLKREFEKTIADRQARDDERQQAVVRQKTEAEKFKADWIDKISSVIRPALQEVADEALKPAGWQTNLIGADTATGLEVYKGNMTAPSRNRPNVSFLLPPDGKRITVHIATPGMMTSTGSLTLGEITKDRIQEEALNFFKKLAGG